MVPYAKVSSSRFQVDLQQSHSSILNSTSSRLRQVKPTPFDLRSSSRLKSTYWGRLPGLIRTYAKYHTKIKRRIAIGEETFSKRKELLREKLDRNQKKRIIKTNAMECHAV